jgi:hypothetical protein
MDIEEDAEQDEILNEIVCRRNIGRRTNWCLQSTVLTQRDVVIAASISSSISIYIILLYLVMFQINVINQMIMWSNNRQSPFFGRLLRAYKYYISFDKCTP